MLLPQRANNQASNATGKTSRHLASWNINTCVVQLLITIECGAFVDVPDRILGRTPLRNTILSGTHTMAVPLVDRGATPQIRDGKCNTQPVFATMNGCMRTVELLLEGCNNPGLPNGKGWTLLRNSALMDYIGVFQLLKNGEHVQTRIPSRLETPLHCVARSTRHETVTSRSVVG